MEDQVVVGDVDRDEKFYAELQEQYKDLVIPVRFGNPEETSALIKDFVRRVMCRRVFKLKEVIAEDMEYHEVWLKESMVLLQNHKMLLIEDEKSRKTEFGWAGPRSQISINARNEANRILGAVTQYEKKLAAWKKLWQYFRTQYKDELLNIINCVINARSSDGNFEDAICWDTFIPKLLDDVDDAFKDTYMPSLSPLPSL